MPKTADAEVKTEPPSPAVPCAGDTMTVRYPFVRCEYDSPSEDGLQCVRLKSWRPGVEYEERDAYGEVDICAHGEGEMLLAVEAVYKPGRFPMRVFYTRKFVTPEGKEFGKGGLRIATVEKFRRLSAGYRDAYDIVDYAGEEPQQSPVAMQDYYGFAGHAATDSLADQGESLPF